MIGVHDKRTGITTLRAAPVHLLTHQVKALKGLKAAPVSSQQHMEARATLGEAFGTKKAKANIRARERNRVDVSAMEGVAEHLQDRIEKSTGALPTQGEHLFFASRYLGVVYVYVAYSLQRRRKRGLIAIVSFHHIIWMRKFPRMYTCYTISYLRLNGRRFPLLRSLLLMRNPPPCCLSPDLAG